MNITKRAVFAAFLVGMMVAAGASALANNNDNDNDHPRKLGSTLEVHIFDNGKVLVRGAKITAISGNTISASNTWNSVVLNWTVHTDSSTNLLRRFDGNAQMSDFSVGDFISFSGDLVQTGTSLTVNAKVVKDWSVQKTKAQAKVFEGTLKAISGTVAPITFTLTLSGNQDVTVNVPVGISVLNRNWMIVGLSSFQTGDKVRVWGAREGNTIEASVVRNVSLPR